MSVLFAYTSNRDKKTRIVIPELASSQDVEVVLEESYSYTNNVTNSPIEDGSDIADHIHTAPLVYSLTAMYSNVPLALIDIQASELPKLKGGLAFLGRSLIAPNRRNQQEYANELADSLSEKTSEFIDYIPGIEAFYEQLIVEKHILSIETATKLLENMICIDFSYSRDRSSGAGLTISARFQQIRIVSTDTVEIEERESSISSSKSSTGTTAETKNIGKKKTTQEPVNSRGSLLHGLILGGN